MICFNTLYTLTLIEKYIWTVVIVPCFHASACLCARPSCSIIERGSFWQLNRMFNFHIKLPALLLPDVWALWLFFLTCPSKQTRMRKYKHKLTSDHLRHTLIIAVAQTESHGVCLLLLWGCALRNAKFLSLTEKKKKRLRYFFQIVL